MAKTVDIEEAGIRLDELVQAALAGEEILIARDDKPVAKLLPIDGPKPRRTLGTARGQVRIHEGSAFGFLAGSVCFTAENTLSTGESWDVCIERDAAAKPVT